MCHLGCCRKLQMPLSSVYRGFSSLCLAKGIRILLKGDQCHFYAPLRETEAPSYELMDSRPPEDQLQLFPAWPLIASCMASPQQSSPAQREGPGAELVRGIPAEMERQVSSGLSTKNTVAVSSRCCCTGMSEKSPFVPNTLEKLFWNSSLV